MKKILVIAILALGFAGCSDSDDNGPFSEYDLTGTYRACAPPEVALPGAGYRDITLSFSDANFTMTTQYFSDAGCQGTDLGTESSSGTFSTSGNNINYNYTGGTTIYDIYQVNGTNLRVGDRTGSNNGTSEATRPTDYEDSFEFSKQ